MFVNIPGQCGRTSQPLPSHALASLCRGSFKPTSHQRGLGCIVTPRQRIIHTHSCAICKSGSEVKSFINVRSLPEKSTLQCIPDFIIGYSSRTVQGCQFVRICEVFILSNPQRHNLNLVDHFTLTLYRKVSA